MDWDTIVESDDDVSHYYPNSFVCLLPGVEKNKPCLHEPSLAIAVKVVGKAHLNNILETFKKCLF